MTLRRPLPFLLLSLTLLAGATACDHPGGGPPVRSEGAGSAEAERTREVEEKAADIQSQADAIQSSEGSDQDKIDAVNKLEQERQQMNETAEGGSAEGGN
ncbi:MAG TPA: hypothetical protein VKK31_15720 [Thermoanaerobaculia bacterium]|nr:hypothetical protein [Thermoanaerobaculia bacterium]